MSPPASIEGTFPRSDEAVAGAGRLVDRVGEAYGVPDDALTDLRIALDEIVTNILKYAEGAHEISIRCQVRNECLETTIEDDGVAFDPLKAPVPDVSASLAKRRVGGLGVHFVKQLMSFVDYEREGGRNRLTLRQALETKGA